MFSLRELFKYPVSVFCLFLCIFHMDGAVKFKRKKRKKVQTYTCISIWMEAWRLIKLHFVWKTAVWGCCCVPSGWMECVFGDSLWHPSVRLAFCGIRKPDATRRHGVSTATQPATFTPSTFEHRIKKQQQQQQPLMQRKSYVTHEKVVLWCLTFRWTVWRRWKVLAALTPHPVSRTFHAKRAVVVSSARPVCSSRIWLKWWVEPIPNQVLVMWPFRQSPSCHARMRAAWCGGLFWNENCLWTVTFSGWVMDQILFVFVIFAVNLVLCSWTFALHSEASRRSN